MVYRAKAGAVEINLQYDYRDAVVILVKVAVAAQFVAYGKRTARGFVKDRKIFTGYVVVDEFFAFLRLEILPCRRADFAACAGGAIAVYDFSAASPQVLPPRICSAILSKKTF